jgi:peptide/nickel transport system permease protein
MHTARVVRATVQSVARGTFVQAAHALGLPPWRVLGAHVLPNAAAPLVVSATAMVGQTILIENALSFLGLGVPVPTPSWGAMVDEGRKVFPGVWWVSLVPGAAITLTVLLCNLTGDALRDVLDPRSGESGAGA